MRLRSHVINQAKGGKEKNVGGGEIYIPFGG
jgi:hypothetical protein